MVLAGVVFPGVAHAGVKETIAGLLGLAFSGRAGVIGMGELGAVGAQGCIFEVGGGVKLGVMTLLGEVVLLGEEELALVGTVEVEEEYICSG